jgi:5-formyltetrahydrofolate cyclo-ligase
MSISMIRAQKQAMRQQLRAARREFVTALHPAIAGLCFRKLPSPLAAIIAPGAVIAVYQAKGHEAPTAALIGDVFERGYQMAIPAVTSDEAMTFRLFNPADKLVIGRYGIAEPLPTAQSIVPDVIIAPMLGFDARGNRLGQGGGYYDRYFAAHPMALRIGLAWSVQQCSMIVTEPHDLPMAYILTERELFTITESPTQP